MEISEIRREDVITPKLNGYELIDFGDFEKLEKIGAYTFIRPDVNARGKKQDPSLWLNPDIKYVEADKSWEYLNKIPEKVQIDFGIVKSFIKVSNFKNLGVFFEQASNWNYIEEVSKKIGNSEGASKPKFLNLFGYTGVASVVAAKNGFEVTHVDSSKPVINTFVENLELNKIKTNVRIICEDVLSFLQKEVRKNTKYNLIFVDPPSFGRSGNKVWKISKDLPTLLNLVKQLTNQDTQGIVLNLYTKDMDYSRTVKDISEIYFPEMKVISGNLLVESSFGKKLVSGYYIRADRS
jgi:23S rRNA (cytosine1962-C5)-methyltransferase